LWTQEEFRSHEEESTTYAKILHAMEEATSQHYHL
jgi:hypothetical protein